MSIKSIEAHRELAVAAGIPFNSHDAEHDDIIETIEGCSDGIKNDIAKLSDTISDIEEKIDQLSRAIHNIQYIVVAILIGVLFVAYRLS